MGRHWFKSLSFPSKKLRASVTIHNLISSRDSSDNIVTRLQAGRPVFDSRQGLGIFLLATASSPSSYSMGSRGSFPGGKAAGG